MLVNIVRFTLAGLVGAAFVAPAGAEENAATALGAATASAETPDTAAVEYFVETTLDTLRIRGRIDDLAGEATSSSQGRVGREDLRLRPILREAELLETLPGLIATQHSGDGKSNQLFLRGFNLDHGTDFRTEVEGMPINLPTHGHGHGYTDVNFLIPEFVDAIDFQKGVYYADTGDFGSAGSSRFRLSRRLVEPLAKVEIGADSFLRFVAGGSRKVGRGDLLLGGSFKQYDGPWTKAQDLGKYSGMARYSWNGAPGQRWSVLGLAYDNTWESSDQIPRRLVEDGTISPFDQIDDTLGGESHRYSLSLQWRRASLKSRQSADVWVVDYGLNLWSNFTYFLEDSTAGDQIEQVDDRSIVGGQFRHEQDLGEDGRQTLAVGFQTRTDFIREVALYSTSERERLSTTRRDEVLETSQGLYASVKSKWSPKVRTEFGLRGDLFHFDVESRTIAENSGTETAGIVSPKFGLALGPWAGTEVYVNAGLGYHSNDARGTTIAIGPASGDPAERVDALVGSQGGEVGVRLSPADDLRSTVSVWALQLDSELLFVGDAGTTEASDGSRRVGVEFTNFWRLNRHWAFDLDVAFTRARFRDVDEGQDRIPGALENVVAAGVAFDLASGVFGAARVRHLGEFPLIEDDSVRAESTTLVNASLGYRWRWVRIAATLLNVFDEEDSDIQYFYASRAPGEPADGVEGIHFHPVEPRQLRVSVGYGL